jgi:hypothetical protein
VTGDDPLRAAIRAKQAADKRRDLAAFGITPPADDGQPADPPAPPRVSAGAGTRQAAAPAPPDFDSLVRAAIFRLRNRRWVR